MRNPAGRNYVGAVGGLFGGLFGGVAGGDAGVGVDDFLDDVGGEVLLVGEGEALPADGVVGGDDEDVGDAFDADFFGGGVVGIDADGVIDGGGFHEVLDDLGVFAADADDDEIVFEFLLECREFGNGLAAGGAPGGPEINEDDFAFGIGFGGEPFLDDQFGGGLAADIVGVEGLLDGGGIVGGDGERGAEEDEGCCEE